MEYIVSAAIATINYFVRPSQPVPFIPVPAGLQLPAIGPVDEDANKPKRIRKKKGEPGQPKIRAFKAKNEKEIRAILERITGLKWPSCRPSFLKNSTGRNLELDMYCAELNIAVEHQGQQHLGYIKHFHKNGYSDFEEQKRRDAIKAALLRQHKIRFVTITCTEWDAMAGEDPLVKENFLLLKLAQAN